MQADKTVKIILLMFECCQKISSSSNLTKEVVNSTGGIKSGSCKAYLSISMATDCKISCSITQMCVKDEATKTELKLEC